VKAPWPGDCCILCLEPFAVNGRHAVSEEHVIPKSVLGILTCDFLCCDCNSKSGADLDHALKRDPAIRLAAAKALADDGTLAREMEHRQIWRVQTSVGTLRQEMRQGEISGRWTELEDGSRVAPEDQALNALRGMLAADGHDEAYVAAALQRYLDSEYGELVELSPRIATRKLAAQLAERDLAAPAVSPILLLKIAYEFTSLIVGTAIYAPDPRLIELRTALRERDETSDAFELERLEVRKRAPSPLHGIWFEGNKDHAVIQIRLFGKRAYRVHLKRLAIKHRQVRYTHLILDHEDMFHELGDGEAA
jgi:hypothetical protein